MTSATILQQDSFQTPALLPKQGSEHQSEPLNQRSDLIRFCVAKLLTGDPNHLGDILYSFLSSSL